MGESPLSLLNFHHKYPVPWIPYLFSRTGLSRGTEHTTSDVGMENHKDKLFLQKSSVWEPEAKLTSIKEFTLIWWEDRNWDWDVNKNLESSGNQLLVFLWGSHLSPIHTSTSVVAISFCLRISSSLLSLGTFLCSHMALRPYNWAARGFCYLLSSHLPCVISQCTLSASAPITISFNLQVYQPQVT